MIMKIIILVLLLSSCSQPTGWVNAKLRDHASCELIEDKGWQLFGGCGDNDFFTNVFVCKKNEKIYKGVVCSGILKGATIRWH